MFLLQAVAAEDLSKVAFPNDRSQCPRAAISQPVFTNCKTLGNEITKDGLFGYEFS